MTIADKPSVSAFVCTAAVAFAALSFPASADGNLDCSAYATAAVQLQQKNIGSSCGFQGSGWSSDFNAHFAWCRLDNVKMANLTAEDNARRAAYSQCVQKRPNCQSYAQNAVNAQAANVANNCGFTGGRWSSHKLGHLRWCMTAGEVAPGQETLVRNMHMQQCLGN